MKHTLEEIEKIVKQYTEFNLSKEFLEEAPQIISDLVNKVYDLQHEIMDKDLEIKRLREALEFYAQVSFSSCAILSDRGERARQALEWK